MINIVVCIKQILDPEIQPRDFQVDPVARKAIQGNAALVVSPYDENAIQVALDLKAKAGEAKVTAITVGGVATDKALRRAVAMGCDEGVCLRDALFEDLDSMGVARVLAQGIKKHGTADVVLCGLQAGDWDMGQVGYLLAEELSLPCASLVYGLECEADRLVLTRTTDNGTERIAATAPLLAIVTNHSSNQPRLPSAKGIVMAARKAIKLYSAADLDISAAIERCVTVEDITVPDYGRAVEIIDGESGQEKAVKLVQRLIELKAI